MMDAAYWIALAHLPKWGNAKINKLIIDFYHNKQITISDFFHKTEKEWEREYGIYSKDLNDILKAKSELPNYAFLAENMIDQGFELIPIISQDYSRTLKTNLKTSNSPSLLYVKGDKQLLQENSIAIVGSRNASEISLKFTDNIAKQASNENKIVVSGFAKGVDKQALDSAIKYKGKSIIVLPQGIMTFSSGFKKYYKPIVDGDVLVLSTFFPKAPWKTELAMARNPIIYGLANDIYVAESSEKGGTWSGVIDGLRKGRKIYVRFPNNIEKNANEILIKRGAIPVNFNGNEINNTKLYPEILQGNLSVLSEPIVPELKNLSEKDTISMIREALNGNELTAKELLTKINLKWTPQKLTKYLKSKDFIEVIKSKNKNYFKLKAIIENQQPKLF